jgi:hypothetical protein
MGGVRGGVGDGKQVVGSVKLRSNKAIKHDRVQVGDGRRCSRQASMPGMTSFQ